MILNVSFASHSSDVPPWYLSKSYVDAYMKFGIERKSCSRKIDARSIYSYIHIVISDRSSISNMYVDV